MANYHDIFQKGQDDIVPLAMQAMKLKMEQEAFELNKQKAFEEREKNNELVSRLANLPASLNEGILKSYVPQGQDKPVLDDASGSSDPVAMKQIAMGGIPQGLESQFKKPTASDVVALQMQVDPEKGIPNLIKMKENQASSHYVNYVGPMGDVKAVDVGRNPNAEMELMKLGYKNLEEVKMKKEQTSVANGYFEAVKNDIKKANPDMLDEEVALRAAKQIRREDEESKIRQAKAGRAVFETMPTNTPGIWFKRGLDGKPGYYKVDEQGNSIELSSDTVKRLNLEYQEEKPTNDIKVMQQSVPSVLQLIKQARKDMVDAEESLGPLAGRWATLYSTKAGASNPQFRKVLTDIGLLQTRLMKMHVGARGGVEMMNHFQKYFDAAKDSPENLKAALDTVEQYANEVGLPLKEQRELSRGERKNAPGSNQPEFDVPIKKAPVKGAKLTDPELAKNYMKAANGNKADARKLAQDDGWTF
jgi:hypothetical protein